MAIIEQASAYPLICENVTKRKIRKVLQNHCGLGNPPGLAPGRTVFGFPRIVRDKKIDATEKGEMSTRILPVPLLYIIVH